MTRHVTVQVPGPWSLDTSGRFWEGSTPATHLLEHDLGLPVEFAQNQPLTRRAVGHVSATTRKRDSPRPSIIAGQGLYLLGGRYWV